MDSNSRGNVDLRTNATGNAQTLCVKCHEFFGNPKTDDLCSVCYKKLGNNAEKPANPNTNAGKTTSTAMEEEKKPEEAPKEVKPAQEDASKCWNCSRKVGMQGYKCKCEYTYCRIHRLPEDHECTFDFVSSARTKIEKANPTVVSAKVEKI